MKEETLDNLDRNLKFLERVDDLLKKLKQLGVKMDEYSLISPFDERSRIKPKRPHNHHI